MVLGVGDDHGASGQLERGAGGAAGGGGGSEGIGVEAGADDTVFVEPFGDAGAGATDGATSHAGLQADGPAGEARKDEGRPFDDAAVEGDAHDVAS